MKRTLLLLLIIPLNSHAKGAHKLSKTVTSIMGIDAEDRDKDRLALNFETDVYYYQATDYAAPMLTYSTQGWDLGVSSQNVLMSGGGGSQNFQNDTYLNIAKTFKYGHLHKSLDRLSTTVGTQNGLVIPLSDGAEPGKINHNTLHQFYFIDTDITLIKNRLSVHVGPYYVNQALSTTTSYFGYETGIQAVLIPNKLRFNADYYSGNNGINSNVSGAVAQMTYSYNRSFELFAGVGVPETASGNEFYGLMGFNLFKIFN